MMGWPDDIRRGGPTTPAPVPAPASAWSWTRSLAATVALGVALATLIGVNSAVPDGDVAGGGNSCRAAFGSRRGPVTALAWSPDGSTLAASDWASIVTLRDSASGRRWALDLGGDGPRFVLGWSADGLILAAWGLDGAIESRAVGPGPGPEGAGGTRAEVAPARAATGTSLRLFGPADRRSRAVLPAFVGEPNALAFGRDGRAIASGSADGLVRVWDAADGRERLSFRSAPGAAEVGGVNSVAFAPDGATLATAGVGPVRTWDAATGAPKSSFGADSPGFGVVAFSPDGAHLAGASWNRSLRIWEVATGREVARLPGHPGRILTLAWSPDGRSLASGGYDGSVRIWDVPGGR